MNRNSVFFLFVAVSSALGFYLGRSTIKPDAKSVDEPKVEEPLDAQLQKKENELIFLRSKLRSRNITENPDSYANLSSDGVRSLLRKALNDANPITRSATFASLLSDLSPQNIDAVLDVYEDIPMGFENMHEYQLLLFGWAKFDPQGAIDYCKERATGIGAGFATSGVLHGWASENPRAALAWVQAPENVGMSKLYNFGLVRGWASKDLPEATAYVAGLEKGGDRHELVKILTREQLKKGFSPTRLWVESIDDQDMKKSAFTNLTQQRSREHPVAVASWLKEHAGEAYAEGSLQRLGDNWGQRDPAAAALFFDELPAGEGRTGGMKEVVKHWTKEDPEATGNWINQKDPSPEMDPVVAAYAKEVSKADGAGAMKWAVTITEPKLQEEVVTSVGHNWYRQDKDSVESWLPQSGLAEETQNAIRKPPKQGWFEKLFR